MPTSRNRIRLWLAPYDVACALGAPFIAIAIRDPALLSISALSDDTAPLWIITGVAIVSALFFFLAFRLSDGMSRFFSVHDVISVSASLAMSAATTSLVLFTFTRLEGVPRSTPIIYAMALGGLLILGRAFHRVVVQTLVIALTGERLDKRAVLEALTWRNQHVGGAGGRLDEANRPT